MTSQHPRDMRDYLQQLERIGRTQRSLPALIQTSAERIRDGVDRDLDRSPAAPIELTYQTAHYIDTQGRARVRFLMDFPDVVFTTDGTPISIQQYELWGREETPSALDLTTSAVAAVALPGATLPSLAATDSSEQISAEAKPWMMLSTNTGSFFRAEGFIPGSVWRFRARAIGTRTITPGAWSAEIVVQMLKDTTPPPQPTAPKAFVERGTITVTWDGQAVSGAMPADFKYVILAHGTDSSPTFEVARFGRGGGSWVLGNIPYYDPQFFRLRAVDESGNLGPWSEQASAFVTPLVDADVILSTIDAAKTHLRNIDAGVSILPNTVITEHLVVTEEMTAAIANFLYLKADKIDVNSLAADTAFVGLLDAKLVVSDMFEGGTFTGGTFTGSRFQTNVEEYTGVKVDTTGILAYSAGGVETLRVDAATGNVTIGGGTFTGGLFQSSSFANTGVKLDGNGLKIWNTNGQLALNATPSGSTFTGTIKSGFGASSAQIGEGVFDGRPGLVLNTGSGYYADPFIITYPQSHANTSRRGALYLSGAWTVNTASPGRILLSENGDMSMSSWKGSYVVTTDYAQLLWSDRRLYMGWNMYMSNNKGGLFEIDGDTNDLTLSGATTRVFGNLTVSGSKNFVMDHPTKPGMELLHGATESPVSGIQYWGCGVIGPDGSALVRLPEYFEALAKPGTACLGVWGNGAVVGWDAAVVDNSFTVTGPAGTAFTWDMKAERVGADFEVERVKVEWVSPDTTA